MSDKKDPSRVLGYRVARELTAEELQQVAGGASSNRPSYSGFQGMKQDDVVTDEF